MNNIVTVTTANFDQIIANNEIVVIDFWAQWCEPCLAFSNVIEQIAKQYPEVIFGKINTEEQTGLAQEFSIRSIPNIMVFRGKVMLYNEAGVLPAAALKDLIDQAKALDMEQVCKNLGEENSEISKY